MSGSVPAPAPGSRREKPDHRGGSPGGPGIPSTGAASADLGVGRPKRLTIHRRLTGIVDDSARTAEQVPCANTARAKLSRGYHTL